MKKTFLLLIPLIFIACKDAPQPTPNLESEFKPYAKVESSCIRFLNDETQTVEGDPLFEKEQQECREFIEVLNSADRATKHMNKNKNNAAFYVAKDDCKFEKNRLKIKHKHLNLVFKDKALDAIEADDLETFTKIINFSYHPMNLAYYRYMQKHIDRFKEHAKMLHFEKKFSDQQYRLGYKLVNKGKYTQGLNALKLAADMKHTKAAMLCGKTYDFLYPSKAIECYEKAIENGENRALYYIAKGYEENDELNEAKAWYLKSAKSGNFIAQYKVYELEKNDDPTQVWLKKSAESGYDKAQYVYGSYLMENGQADKAIKYLLLASDQGFDDANFPLGKLYFLKKKYKKAYHYLSRGDINLESAYILGKLSEEGKGTAKNLYMASNYYQKAKEFGKRGVQNDLNRVYRAKKKLRSQNIRQQQSKAKAKEALLLADRQKRHEAMKEDRRIRAEMKARRQQGIRLKAQACGEEVSDAALRSAGSRIHIEGRVIHWLGRKAFIVVSNTQEFYINDEEDEARVNKGDTVNIVAVSTGQREITQGMRQNLFEMPDERTIKKAYALNYEGVCPY